MLAMVVNDYAGSLTPSGVLAAIASMLAPTVGDTAIAKMQTAPAHIPVVHHKFALLRSCIARARAY